MGEGGVIKGFQEIRGPIPHWVIWPFWRSLIAVDDWFWSHLKVGRRIELLNRLSMNASDYIVRPILRRLEHMDSSVIRLKPCA